LPELKRFANIATPIEVNLLSIAQMAELVDALDSKSGYRKVVQVRFLFWAQKYPVTKLTGYFFV
jgi:hypothetical protein